MLAPGADPGKFLLKLQVHGSAYNRTVELASGGSLRLQRRQRPHVFMEGGVPRYLYNGVMLASGETFTMVQQTRKRQKTDDDEKLPNKKEKKEEAVVVAVTLSVAPAAIFEVSEGYCSTTIDSSYLTHPGFDQLISSSTLITLAKALAPGRLVRASLQYNTLLFTLMFVWCVEQLFILSCLLAESRRNGRRLHRLRRR